MRAHLGVVLVVLSSCSDLPSGPESSIGVSKQALSAPFLVRDLNTVPATASSNPTAFVALSPTRTLFFATTASEGAEPWRTDGTAQGTSLVRDIAPGTASSVTGSMVALNGVAYFAATTPQSGTELWRSDGTAPGTWLVTDFVPGASGTLTAGPVVVGNRVLYVSSTTGAYQLAATDGVTTSLVKSFSLGPTMMVSDGAHAYFDALDTTFGPRQLWTSDGTVSGTHLAAAVVTSSSQQLSSLTAGGAGAYFVLTGGSPNRMQVWTTDGTDAGTLVVKDLTGGTTTAITSLRVSGPRLYFLARAGPSTTTLWAMDGVDAGRSLGTVAYAPPAALPSDRLVFTGTDTEPWVTDASDAGTFRLADLSPAGSTTSSDFASSAGHVWFTANGGAWVTDGTSPGTVQVAGSGLTAPSLYLEGHGALTFFRATGAGVVGVEPWVSDGTAAGTRMLADVAPARSSSSPSNLAALGPRVVFAASEPTTGVEVWSTDGTSAGTRLVKDLVPGSGNSVPSRFELAQGWAYFTANDSTFQSKLHRTDGSDAGIQPLGVSASSLYATGGTPVGFFATVQNGSTYDVRLWTADAGPTLLRTFSAPTAPARAPDTYLAIGDTAFFQYAGTIYRTNGTAVGTLAVAGGGGPQVYDFVELDGFLYFTSNNGQLMRLNCDGTTTAISGTTDGTVGYATRIGNQLFYAVRGAFAVPQLWRHDGTNPPVLVKSFVGPDVPANFVDWNGLAVFFADEGTGRRLFISDGTTAGTRPLTSLVLTPPPVFSGAPPNVFPTPQDGLLVAAATPDSGVELWSLDGGGGEALLADLAPGAASSNPSGFQWLGSRVVFSADDGTGRELWAVDVSGGAGGGGGSSPSACAWTWPDAGVVDAGTDAGVDAGVMDAGVEDAGIEDAGIEDAGAMDAGAEDAGLEDAGATDAGAEDAGAEDAGASDDAGTLDGGGTGGGSGGGSAGGGTGGGSVGGGSGGGGDSSPSGCGCGSAAGAEWLLGGLVLVLRRRRRRP